MLTVWLYVLYHHNVTEICRLCAVKASNLATPCSAWIFLFLVVLLSCLATYVLLGSEATNLEFPWAADKVPWDSWLTWKTTKDMNLLNYIEFMNWLHRDWNSSWTRPSWGRSEWTESPSPDIVHLALTCGSSQVQSLRFLGRWHQHQLFRWPSLHRGERLLLVEHHRVHGQLGNLFFWEIYTVSLCFLSINWQFFVSEVLSNHSFLPCDSTDPGHASSSSERLQQRPPLCCSERVCNWQCPETNQWLLAFIFI